MFSQGAFIHDQSSHEDSQIKVTRRQCEKKKHFLEPASRPFQESFISYMSPDCTSQSHNMIQPLWSDSLPRPCREAGRFILRSLGEIRAPHCCSALGCFHLGPRAWRCVGYQYFSWWWGPGRERKARGKNEAQENRGERMARNERPEQAVPGGKGKWSVSDSSHGMEAGNL